MKRLSIAKKFTMIAIIVTLVMLVIGYFVLNIYKSDLTQEVYSNVKNELQNLSNQKIKGKFEVGISNAISISNDGQIKKALSTKNRDLAINALGTLSSSMKESTPFKNIKVHIHTKDTYSFYVLGNPKNLEMI